MSLIKSIKFVGTNFDVIEKLCREAHNHEGNLKVTIEPWSDKRTISANAQQHVWYAKIAKQDGEDVQYIQRVCKLMHGLPILLADAEIGRKLKWTLDKLGFFNWAYEQQVGYMDFVPVTSLMSTKQHNEFRDNMMNYYNKNGYCLDYIT